MNDLLLKNSKLHGEYYSLELKDYFSYGEVVKIYSNYSYRLFTINKDNRIYRIHYTELGTVFFTKDEWRERKLNKILK